MKQFCFLISFFVLSVTILLFMPKTNMTATKSQETKVTIKVMGLDRRGRVSLAKIQTRYGACLCEVVYNLGPYPEIHVVVITETRLQNIGHLAIRHKTENTVTHAELMDLFSYIRDEKCLPNILPGYIKT